MGRYVDPSQRERSFAEVAEAWLGSNTRLKDSNYWCYRQELDNYVLPS